METRVVEQTVYNYFKLVGKTAIVIGVENGTGRRIAEILVGLGVNVVVCDIEKENVEDVMGEITSQGLFAVAVHYGVRKYEDVQNVIRVIIDTYEAVNILVNDAAGYSEGVAIDDITEGERTRLIELSLNSVYRFTTSVLSLMRVRRGGRIVNISSGAGIVGDFSDSHYAAAEGGVIAFSEEIAHEVTKDYINVNCVAPGLVNTKMTRIRPWEDEIANTLWHRVEQPEDIACAVAYMVSAVSGYCTGQVLSPNGGVWMQQTVH